MIFLFFFFKQKTAYEVRISDWSSDVCSSDLLVCNMHEEIDEAFPLTGQPVSSGGRKWTSTSCTTVRPETSWMPETRSRQIDRRVSRQRTGCARHDAAFSGAAWKRTRCDGGHDRAFLRSEEHTSALQSLMRISYAVFCLKTK